MSDMETTDRYWIYMGNNDVIHFISKIVIDDSIRDGFFFSTVAGRQSLLQNLKAAVGASFIHGFTIKITNDFSVLGPTTFDHNMHLSQDTLDGALKMIGQLT
jgi:hypothetical protein